MKVLYYLLSAFLMVVAQDPILERPPYLVSIQEVLYEFDSEHTHICSGVIISPFWVLTSGMCMHTVRWRPPFPAYVVVAGTLTVNGTDNRQEITSDITNQFSADGFYRYNDFSPYDLALLQLNYAFTFNEYVQPIRLPERNSAICGDTVISGWGVNANASASILPVIEFDECQNQLDVISDGQVQLANNSNFCTGPVDGSTGTCYYDRGSPLVQDDVVIGIATWGSSQMGVDCGKEGVPSIFTQVDLFLDFIESHVTDYCPPCQSSKKHREF